ncbi:MAG TPA: nucleotide disphospho-sugar-binding domain-containing protein [Acidobacteriota bacterium]|nr:nucleotide disphospho-sugar-binding domain-containing protein [Acidobacteriota bacterium]
MSRFLFTVLPSNDFGLLTRSLPIAAELTGRGHEVFFCHPARGPQMLIRDGGFKNRLPADPAYCFPHNSIFRLIGGRKTLRNIKMVASFVRGFMKFRGTELWNVEDFHALFLGNADFIRTQVAALTEIIESTRPDAVVDFWNPCSYIAAKFLKKPFITVIQSHQHPKSPGFIFWKEPPSGIPTAVPLINEILSEYGLPKIKSTGDLFVGDLTMVVGMPELDPIEDTTGVTYIGAVLWQNPETRIPEWVADLKTDKPVVWIYPGALRYPGNNRQGEILLRAAIQSLAGEDVQVVISTGHHDIPRSWLPLPPNFRFEPFVPGITIAKRSDLMIHHGGYGSCQTGLYVGTPAVIVPTYSERESNARRIVAQGAGEVVLPTYESSRKKMMIDVAELKAKIHKVLSGPSYKENARRISAKLKEYGGAPKAAHLIEEVVKNRRSAYNR